MGANQLRHRRPRHGDKRHWDKMFCAIQGERHDPWRAVDQDRNVLNILIQRRRDKKAAKKFSQMLLKRVRDVSRVILTDRLQNYGVAQREMLPAVQRAYATRKLSSVGMYVQLPGHSWDAITSQGRILGHRLRRKAVYYQIVKDIREIIDKEDSSRKV